MRVGFAIVLCCVVPQLAAADDGEAYRLLKSWGMQFDAGGQLHFKPEQPLSTETQQPWQPDLSGYLAEQTTAGVPPLEPVIIRTRRPTNQ